MAGLVALAAGYVLSQFYRSFLAVLSPVLASDLGAAASALSMASGAWFVSFALMQFVVGVWLDRFGPRRTAAILLICGGGGGALLFAMAWNAEAVIVAMALNGAGCSAVLMASFFIFAKTFSQRWLSVLVSALVGVGMLGNVIGSAPLAFAAELFGWRQVMGGLAGITIATGLLILVLVRDPAAAIGDGGDKGGLRGYLLLLKVRALWPILPLMALNYAAAAGIRGLWAGPFLFDIHGADAILIGEATLLMALAMSAGSFVYGPLDVLLRTRKWVAFAGNGICAAALVLLAAFPFAGIAEVTILFVLIGLCGTSFGLLMAHGQAFFPSELTGRGATLLNFFSVGGAGVMQMASGLIFDLGAVPGEPVAAYRVLFGFYAVLTGAALAIYLGSRDAPPQRAR